MMTWSSIHGLVNGQPGTFNQFLLNGAPITE
jgi:hypothetical protein